MSLRVVSQSSDSTDSLDRVESSESVESVVESRDRQSFVWWLRAFVFALLVATCHGSSRGRGLLQLTMFAISSCFNADRTTATAKVSRV